jgi:hypothetical protein
MALRPFCGQFNAADFISMKCSRNFFTAFLNFAPNSGHKALDSSAFLGRIHQTNGWSNVVVRCIGCNKLVTRHFAVET